MWLSNCSEDVNSSMCDYATQVAWKINDTTMEHYHDKGLLGWLDGGLAPPHPRIILNKQSGPEQWDVWKTCCEQQKIWNLDRTFHRDLSWS